MPSNAAARAMAAGHLRRIRLIIEAVPFVEACFTHAGNVRAGRSVK
jgi:hypothetical protein